METSKAYFEDTLRRFETERRGRTLFQFCRAEAVEYKDMIAYKRSMETKGKTVSRENNSLLCTLFHNNH